jgi:hypothetical protein
MEREPNMLLKATTVLYIVAGVFGFLVMAANLFIVATTIGSGQPFYGILLLICSLLAIVSSALLIVSGVRALQGRFTFGMVLVRPLIVLGTVELIGFAFVQQIDPNVLAAFITIALPLLFRVGVRESRVG